MIFEPHPYQGRGIALIKGHTHCGLWWSPGCGKTPTVAMALVDLLDSLTVNRVLVVAPKRVALNTWPKELAKWEQTRHLRVSVIMGTPKERVRALEAPADVWVISFEQFRWLMKRLRYRKRLPFDMIVVDESSKAKSPSSKTFQALRAACASNSKARQTVDRVVLLTGTPAPNGLLDIWSQTFLLDRGQRLFPTYTDYRTNYFWQVNADYDRWAPLPQSPGRIHALVADLYDTLDARDVLDIPDALPVHEVPADLPDHARALYQRLKDEGYLDLGEAGEVDPANLGVLTGKYRQLANGCLFLDDGRWQRVHDGKLEALEDLLEELGGEPILLAYQFKPDLIQVKERFKRDVVLLDDDPRTQDRWNAGKIRILATYPGAAAHGLNLQYGGHNTVWYGLTWNLEDYLQLNERLGDTRQFQSKTGKRAVVHHIVAPNTIEDRVMAPRLIEKWTDQETLKRAVQYFRSQA